MTSIINLSFKAVNRLGYGCKIDSLPIEKFNKVKLR